VDGYDPSPPNLPWTPPPSTPPLPYAALHDASRDPVCVPAPSGLCLPRSWVPHPAHAALVRHSAKGEGCRAVATGCAGSVACVLRVWCVSRVWVVWGVYHVWCVWGMRRVWFGVCVARGGLVSSPCCRGGCRFSPHVPSKLPSRALRCTFLRQVSVSLFGQGGSKKESLIVVVANGRVDEATGEELPVHIPCTCRVQTLPSGECVRGP
jgi:hypothetical protein